MSHVPPVARNDFGEPTHFGHWPQPGLSDVTLMMIDDEPMMTEVTQTYLEEAGYQRFVSVNDPTEAMEVARRVRPGLILLDLMMPVLSGFDLLRQIRADENLRYTPVIVLTGASDPMSKLRALALGATEFLSKPVDESELKIRVRNSLAFKVYQDRLANDDPLTGLPNRRVFVEHLQGLLLKANQQRRRLALLHLNLDRFRQINDTLGHGAGDALLSAVADRLRVYVRADSSLGEGAFLARTGGDEFSLVLPDIGQGEAAGRVARQMMKVMGKSFYIDGRDLLITASIGISVYPDDGGDDAALVRNADVAMKHAKDSGSNTFQFYSDELNHVSLERLLLETQLRRAIARDELVLHYQPKIDLATGRVFGAEALLRWNHSERGLIPPGQFIPIAEETGLIVEIGEWVVDRACAQMAEWRETQGLNLSVAVNVARHGLTSGSLAEVVKGAMTRHNIVPGALVLELTESMLMDRVDEMAEKLRALRALGVELSIDDFGTGYSSMSYLKNFPVQELKIDRSFINGTPHDRTDLAIVRALVVLGHSLGMRVVAEGVETEAQRTSLIELGCDTFQGFLCSPALAPDDFIARLGVINGLDLTV
jgi:diguanylate cyclase (GGDEF)-like protein